MKAVGNTTIYVRDVAHVRDGFAPQTNIVRRDGQRGALLTIMKTGSASTLDIVQQVRELLPRIGATLPPALKIEPIADQSLFVRAAVNGVIREAIIAACLTAMMILLFLGSWRSTLIIAISIPLSILTSICVLSALGETINIMTLGGLALAVGILVDDATVTIENIDRNLDQGKDLRHGNPGRRGADRDPGFRLHAVHLHRVRADVLPDRRRALPVRAAGGGRGVRDARVLSACRARWFRPGDVSAASGKRITPRKPAALESARPVPSGIRARLRAAARRLSRTCWPDVSATGILFLPAFLALCCLAFLLVPWLGQDFFPTTDAGQFSLHFRAKTGTRIEETARLADLVENVDPRRSFPPTNWPASSTTSGFPTARSTLAYSKSAPIGTMDADIMVTLNPEHRPTDRIRAHLAAEPAAGSFRGVLSISCPRTSSARF